MLFSGGKAEKDYNKHPERRQIGDKVDKGTYKRIAQKIIL